VDQRARVGEIERDVVIQHVDAGLVGMARERATSLLGGERCADGQR